MRLLHKICILLTCLFPALLSAQKEIAFEHLSIPEGLSNPQVFALIQDRLGYISIGTQDGLNRYDGYQFITYRNEPGDTTSIMDNFVFAAFEDSNGTLWFGNSSGLSRYDHDINHFRNFHPVPVSAAIPNQFVNAIGQKDRNHLWIGCNLGLYLMDTRDDTFKPQFVLASDVEKEISGLEKRKVADYSNVNDLLIAGDSLLWLAINQGLIKYDLKKGDSESFLPDNLNINSVINNIRDLYRDAAGHLRRFPL